ncbi:MAG: hypothetical protein COA50_11090 [Flavobacteriaceae bacterium]|nr:MAG: hypothetical protein COA50_11090 [Flavobacteriaceae bacterium]
MIKFFSKIRQRLLTENKFSKYLLYAIGEIVLVVIGILIALSINTWNHNLADEKKSKIILENLHEEFVLHKEKLAFALPNYAIGINANINLVNLCGHDSITLTALQIDTILSQTFKGAPFNPPQPILDELLNTGNLNLIQNKKLQQYLFEWESKNKHFKLVYSAYWQFDSDQLAPYLNKHWSWKNLEIAGGTAYWKDRSKLKTNVNAMFQDIEFENLFTTNAFHLTRLQNELKQMDQLLISIIAETEIN